MKQINRWGISAGLVALVGMAVFAASCSDDKKGATGVGGSSSTTGGAGSDTGGATNAGGQNATGGTTSTSTQATGGGGNDQDSGTVLGCTSANTDLARTDGLIADFAGTGAAGIQVGGDVTTYPPGGDAAPDAEITNGSLHITEDAAQTTSAQYVGTVLYFNDCIDASAFKGVEFTISGTMSSACTLQYSTNHSAANNSDPKGTCDLGEGKCYSPQKGVTVTDTETVVKVAWADATGGSPAIPVDPSKLNGVQWQFTIASGTGTCTADLTIKNVKFFN